MLKVTILPSSQDTLFTIILNDTILLLWGSMTKRNFKISFRRRLVFYLGGFLFASIIYGIGIFLLAIESASINNTPYMDALIHKFESAIKEHKITFIVWELLCAMGTGYVAFLFHKEVSLRRRAEKRANIDGLTEIFNHRYFQAQLGVEIGRADRYGRNLSLVMLDLDNFKAYNDTWGHQEGDKLLRWFAALCKRYIRNIDTLARYGGEEFVIILPETDRSEALAVAERIRETTEKHSLISMGANRGVTVSAGVATFPADGKTRHSLLLNADAALYYAKQQGKNMCITYEEECHRSYRASSGHIKSVTCDDSLEAIEALGTLLDARDVNSKGHSLTVMHYAVAI